jgi:hypothetical protein
MAAERRSLTEGLDQIGGVDLETARAFIVQERPREVKPAPVAPVLPVAPIRVVADPQLVQAAEPEESAEAARGGEKIAPPIAAKRPSKPAAKRPDTARILSTLLVPVTIRLRPEVAAALKHASLQRQLNGVETYTQQDIVEEALVPWLQAEGLLD